MFTQKFKYVSYVMWALPLLFFTFQFILRLWPGLMMNQIMDQFSIDATRFGIIAALYYYGYAGMQIPVAMLLDRFQTRYIILSFAVLCGVATLLFTYSTNWYVACLSRFLIGAGSAVGFLGVSKVVSEWFPKTQYSRMIGFSFTFGLMGAIYGGKPISLLIEAYPWKNVALVLAAISITIGVLSYLVLRPRQNPQTHERHEFKLTDFKVIFSSPVLWLLALANLLMVGSLEGFSDVWGVPYLMTAYAITKSKAAELISFVFFGMLFGGPILALCSKRIGNYAVIALCGVGMAVAFSLLLLCSSYQWWLLVTLFFCIGVMCCYQVIVFAAGSELVKPQYLGVTIAFLNCINMLGGSFFHTCIGKMMDMFWYGDFNADGVKLYTLVAYRSALLLIPACALIGTAIVCFLRLKIKQKTTAFTLSYAKS